MCRRYVNLIDLTGVSSESEVSVGSDAELDELPHAAISLASHASSLPRK